MGRKKRMSNIPEAVKEYYIGYMREHPYLSDKEYQERFTPSKTTIGRLHEEAVGLRRRSRKRNEPVVASQPAMFIPVTEVVTDTEKLLQAMRDDPESFLAALGIKIEGKEET